MKSSSLLHCSCTKANEMLLVVAEHDAVTGQGFVAIFGLHCRAALVMDDGSTIVEPFLRIRTLISKASDLGVKVRPMLCMT